MRVFSRFGLTTVLVAAASVGLVFQASAQPRLLGLAVHQSSNIKVSRCDPQQGNTFVSSAYVPGYYPVGRYYWTDVYGRRFYQPAVTRTNPELSIDYTNEGAKVATQIEFGLVARGHLVAEVRDVGTFSPGAEIKHRFGLSPNVFPIGTGLAQCVPLRITYQDGTKWRSHRLPALMQSR